MRSDPAAKAAHSAIQSLQQLPPLSAVACQLLEEATREDADLHRLAGLIEQDPGLVARIIGIANSAYFRRHNEVCTVADAIIRVLGLNLVRSLAIGIALSRPFDASRCPEFDTGRYWYHAMTTATLASRLAPHLRVEHAQLECLFLAGLLQTLGRFALVHLFPERMSQVFHDWKLRPDADLLELETLALATNEIEGGAIIASKWHLPESITDTISYRNEPHRSQHFTAVVELINFCSGLAEQLFEHPDSPPQPPASKPAALMTADATLAEILQRMVDDDPQMRALAVSIAEG
jgi:HD-like signal output (HDOD) protein